MERDHLGDLGVDVKGILKWILRIDWIDLAQHKGRWRGLVIAVMNLRVP
jgi:hypothetical protein